MLVLLMDEVVVIGAVVAVLWYFNVGIPLWVSITLGVLLGGVVIIIHTLVIPSFHRKKVTGGEGMVGLKGEAVEPLRPEGMVQVGGEYWKAKSQNGEISRGERVEVVVARRLTLEVKRRKE